MLALHRNGPTGADGRNGARGATPEVLAAIGILRMELACRDATSWTEIELTQHYGCEILIRSADPAACVDFAAYLDRSRVSVGDRAAILSQMVRDGVLATKHPRFCTPLLCDPMWDTVDAVHDAFAQAHLPAPEWYTRRYGALLRATSSSSSSSSSSSFYATSKPPTAPPAIRESRKNSVRVVGRKQPAVVVETRV